MLELGLVKRHPRVVPMLTTTHITVEAYLQNRVFEWFKSIEGLTS